MTRDERYRGKSGGERLFRAIMEIVLPDNHQYSRVVEDCRLADSVAARTALALMYKKPVSSVSSGKEAKLILREDIRRKLKTREYVLNSPKGDLEELVAGVKASFDPEDVSVDPGGSGWLFTVTGLGGPYRDYLASHRGNHSVKENAAPGAPGELSERLMEVHSEDYDPSQELRVKERTVRGGWAADLRSGSAGFYVASVLETGCVLSFKDLVQEVHKLNPGVKEGTIRVAIHFLRKRGVPIVKEGKRFKLL